MKAGERFAERFELEGLAGSGGMGAVYRARDLSTDTVVALKILLRASDGPRFEREARILAEIESPAVVRYVAHGTDSVGRQCLANPGGGRALAARTVDRGARRDADATKPGP